MGSPRLTRLELQIMETLWGRGPCSVRAVLETFPARGRPAYTTVQTLIYRLEANQAVGRVPHVGNANIFDATVSRGHPHFRIIAEVLALFGGSTQPVIAHLIEAGKLTADDVREAEAAV